MVRLRDQVILELFGFILMNYIPTFHTSANGTCSCDNSSMNCAFLKKNSLEAIDQCDGNMTLIDLSFNTFTAYPDNVKDSIYKVKISDNYLNAMPRPPQLSSHTTYLDVSRNNIAETSDELKTLSNLQVLISRYNKMASLSFLPSHCSLRHVDAFNNYISNIDGLSNCTTLEYLDLSCNDLSSISGDSLSKLSKLRQLDLSVNKLTSLPSKVFSKMTRLQRLSIAANEFMVLDDDIFVGLPQLKDLYLGTNKLIYLPESLFTNLTRLTELNLSENRLKHLLPKGSAIQSPFADFDSLRSLRLDQNFLQELPDLSGLIHLDTLLLKNNLLSRLPTGIFDPLVNLEYLDISYNKLNYLPEQRQSWMGKLFVLFATNNELKSLGQDWFRDAQSLKYIVLPFNNVSELQKGVFSGLSNLTSLNLYDNNIRDVAHGVFEDLPSLKDLFMDNNEVTMLPEYNALRWPNLQRASFALNNITDLGRATLSSWLSPQGGKRKLDLLQNKIHTTANLRWVLEDPQIETVVYKETCGKLKRGNATVSLCFDIPRSRDRDYTSSTPKNWVEAIRRGWSRSH